MIRRLLNLSLTYRSLVTELELERAKFFSVQRENETLRAELDGLRTRYEDTLRRTNDFLGLVGWNLSIYGVVSLPPREEEKETDELPARKRFAGDVAKEADAQFEREYSKMTGGIFLPGGLRDRGAGK